MNYKKYFSSQLLKKLGKLLYHDLLRKIIVDLIDDPNEDWDETFLKSLDKLVNKLTKTNRSKGQ